MPKWNKHQIGLLLSVICFLMLGYLLVMPKAEDKPPYLSFSADRDGTKAWMELLREHQAGVKEWRRGVDELPKGGNQLLVSIQPDGISQAEQAEIIKWAELGNDFILFQKRPAGWALFPLKDTGGTGAGESKKIQREGDTSGATLAATVTTGYRLSTIPEQQVLFSDEQGALASRVAVGQGSVTAVLTPEWLMNERILEHSHFELVWPLFGKGWKAIWVDEAHHGLRTQPGLLAVYPAWLVLACVQLALALLFWLWRRGKRFGPVYTPRAWTVRRGDETLQAVAGWYERRGYRAEALEHQQRLLRQLLLERWGLSPSASAGEAAEAARARWPQAQAAKLARLLEQSEPAAQLGGEQPPRAKRGVSAKAFVKRTREMGEIIEKLEKE
jgi:hypothetical protein